jgi:hypothetical protein
VLRQNAKQYDQARAAFHTLYEDFPNRHEPPMRMAYLELEVQGAKSNAKRDYTETKQWYDKAKDLYDARPSSSGDDPAMQRLTSIVADLEKNGWFDPDRTVYVTEVVTVTETSITTKAIRVYVANQAYTLRIATQGQEGKFTGYMLNGKPDDSNGTYVADAGWKYVGAWKDGKMHGQGTLSWGDEGYMYVGQWKNGKRDGYGTSSQGGSVISQGQWKNDAFVG